MDGTELYAACLGWKNDGEQVIGIYSTKENADAALNKFLQESFPPDYGTVYKMKVDAVPENWGDVPVELCGPDAA